MNYDVQKIKVSVRLKSKQQTHQHLSSVAVSSFDLTATTLDKVKW